VLINISRFINSISFSNTFPFLSFLNIFILQLFNHSINSIIIFRFRRIFTFTLFFTLTQLFYPFQIFFNLIFTWINNISIFIFPRRSPLRSSFFLSSLLTYINHFLFILKLFVLLNNFYLFLLKSLFGNLITVKHLFVIFSFVLS
jgi:hypothetical protein